MGTTPIPTRTHTRPAVVGMPVIKVPITPRYASVLWSTGWSLGISMLQLWGPSSTEHFRPLEPKHYPWHTAAANVGHHSTQHPAYSAKLGVDICHAVGCLQHLHPHGAGLPVVPAIPAAISGARTGKLRRGRGRGETRRGRAELRWGGPRFIEALEGSYHQVSHHTPTVLSSAMLKNNNK